MRIAIFGGTFDPPHIGHLILAQSLINSLTIEKVLFIPVYIPPHKVDRNITDSEKRIKMLHLSIDDNPKFEVSLIEIERKGVSYSIDTINQIREKYKLKKDELFFAIGSDSIVEFNIWKSPMEILNKSTVVVFPRPGFELSQVKKEYREKSIFLKTPLIDISSRMIREMVKKGLDIKYLVTEKVYDFIKKNKLYR
ncbi:MAG: nicotinate-nucleotide adenylyltransferase [Candidatus Marinimicrobia bacterium]|nr:nicotinate-nucleotide adenylyltransferase [Candidatus Neomarinimicrobiota bacterium]